MTSIELLKQDLDAELKLGTKMVVNWDMYIEMHKQEIIDAWNGGDYAYFYSKETGRDFADGNDYYQETFVSKGSDECPFFISLTKTTSATICSVCGKEKYLHKP